jgi:NhaP-type Na+/H+ or K+/H+ antiporter
VLAAFGLAMDMGDTSGITAVVIVIVIGTALLYRRSASSTMSQRPSDAWRTAIDANHGSVLAA